jgi:hypothetical protein
VRASVAGHADRADRSIRAWFAWDWRVMLAGAAIAAALIAGATWLAGSTPRATIPAPAVAKNVPDAQPAVMTAPPVVSVVPRRGTSPGRRVVRTGGGGRNAPPAAGARAEVPEMPEVIVAPDQAIAVRRLLQAFREKRLAIGAAPGSLDGVIDDLPSLPVIEIPLIAIEPLPEPSGSDKERNQS